MPTRLAILSLLIAISIGGCEINQTSNNPVKPRFTILPGDWSNGLFSGNFHTPIAVGSRIYTSKPLRYFELDKDLRIVEDSVVLFYHDAFEIRFGFPSIIQMRKSPNAHRLLTVRSRYPNVSIGALEEIEIEGYKLTVLLDSSYSISSAVYASEDTILFHTYGSTSLPKPGIYRLVPGDLPSLVLEVQDAGPIGIANAFDYDRRSQKLYIPIANVGKAPLLLSYNIADQEVDSITEPFQEYVNSALSVRLNSTGSRLLISLYPFSSLTPEQFVYTRTFMGVADVHSWKVEGIPHVPFSNFSRAVPLFPDWLPGELQVVYGCSPVSSAGLVGQTFKTIITDISH